MPIGFSSNLFIATRHNKKPRSSLADTVLGPSLRQEWPAQIHSLDPDLFGLFFLAAKKIEREGATSRQLFQRRCGAVYTTNSSRSLEQ